MWFFQVLSHLWLCAFWVRNIRHGSFPSPSSTSQVRSSGAWRWGCQQLQSVWLADLWPKLESKAFSTSWLPSPLPHLEKMTQVTVGYSCHPLVQKMPCRLWITSKWEHLPWLSPRPLLSKGHGICWNLSVLVPGSWERVSETMPQIKLTSGGFSADRYEFHPAPPHHWIIRFKLQLFPICLAFSNSVSNRTTFLIYLRSVPQNIPTTQERQEKREVQAQRRFLVFLENGNFSGYEERFPILTPQVLALGSRFRALHLVVALRLGSHIWLSSLPKAKRSAIAIAASLRQ